MRPSIDHLLAELRALPADRSLDRLESDVWQAIDADAANAPARALAAVGPALAALKSRPSDRPLHHLESEVWRRIDGKRPARLAPSWSFGLQSAAAVLALFIGIAFQQTAAPAGDIGAVYSETFAAFDEAELAPSTNL